MEPDEACFLWTCAGYGGFLWGGQRTVDYCFSGYGPADEVATKVTGPRDETVILPSGSAAPSEARRFIRLFVEAGELREAAELLVSELVTNAVNYGEGPVDLTVRLGAVQIRIEVSDANPARPTIREPDLNGRRGLNLVEALARRWGVDGQPDGKTVWVELSSQDTL